MKTTAAVLVEARRPLQLAELEIPQLKPGQVLVEIAFSGVCHTQLLECRGYRGEDRYLPHCLGHEGSGVIAEVGPGVTRCKTGDHVVLSWIKGSGADIPGTVYDWNGRTVNAGGVTTFSRHSVVSENRLTVIPSDVDLKIAALLGCAVPTGAGAVFNTARVRPTDSVAVFGAGGIGVCAVAAASISGAFPIFAVDVDEKRLQVASEMGATHTINGTVDDPIQSIKQVCPRGIDVSIEASGRPDVMLQALAAVRSQGGTTVIAGNARHGERLDIDPGELNQGKRLLGTWGGDNVPDRDFPKYCQLLTSGRLSVAPLLSQPYSLTDINTALDDLESRRVPRPLIDMNLA